jgi:hypothetical protein
MIITGKDRKEGHQAKKNKKTDSLLKHQWAKSFNVT